MQHGPARYSDCSIQHTTKRPRLTHQQYDADVRMCMTVRIYEFQNVGFGHSISSKLDWVRIGAALLPAGPCATPSNSSSLSAAMQTSILTGRALPGFALKPQTKGCKVCPSFGKRLGPRTCMRLLPFEAYFSSSLWTFGNFRVAHSSPWAVLMQMSGRNFLIS